MLLGNNNSPTISLSHVYLPITSTTLGGSTWVLNVSPSGLAIQGPGLYRVAAQIRVQYSGSVNTWVKCALFTSATLGSGQILDGSGNTQHRQLFNQVATKSGGMNLLLDPEWYEEEGRGEGGVVGGGGRERCSSVYNSHFSMYYP